MSLLTFLQRLCLLVILIVIYVGCSKSSQLLELSQTFQRPPPHNYTLEELVPFWEKNAKLCQDGSGADYPTKQHRPNRPQPCHDGDMTLFNGLLCAAGNQYGCDGTKNAQDPASGEWYRSPRIRYLPIDPSRGVRNDEGDAEFSPDMALGVQLYLLKTVDVQAAERWFLHLHNLTCINGGACENPPVFCKHPDCGIRPQDAAALWQTANYLQVNHGMNSLPSGSLKTLMDKEGPRFATHVLAQAVVNKPGFSQNLPGVTILIANMIGLSDVNITEASRLLTDRAQNDHNAFFAYLYEGDTPRVRKLIREECPTPNSPLAKPFREWTWERSKDAEAWRESCMWDCLFAYEILDENYSTPSNPPPGQCLIDDVILDQRDPFVASSDKLFTKPFKLTDLAPKVIDKVKVFTHHSGHSRRYIDVMLPSSSGPNRGYDRSLRLEINSDPGKWTASLTAECNPSSNRCYDNSWYRSVADSNENGFYSFNGRIYQIENGVSSLIGKSPVLKDFIHFDYFDELNQRIPLTMQINNAKNAVVSAYTGSGWRNKTFSECLTNPVLHNLNIFVLDGKVIASCPNLSDGLTYFYTSDDSISWSGKQKPLKPSEQIWPWNKAYRPRKDGLATNSKEVFVMTARSVENKLVVEYYLLSNTLERKRILVSEYNRIGSVLWVDHDKILYSTDNELVLANIQDGSSRVVHTLEYGCGAIFKVPDSDTIYALCNMSSSENEKSGFAGRSVFNVVLVSHNGGLLWEDVTKEVGLW